MKLYWIIGLLVLWAGVVLAEFLTAAPDVSASNETAFMISIKINNRTFNDSLEDQQSNYYKLLRQDVENMFFEIYRSAPAVHYKEISEMTFSNGSVISNSTAIFESNQESGQTIKDIFVASYKEHSPWPLDLNINYTEDHEPIKVTPTHPPMATSTKAISSTVLDKSTRGSHPTTAATHTHSTTPLHSESPAQTTSKASPHDDGVTGDLTSFSPTTLTTTTHLSSTALTTSSSRPEDATPHPISKGPTVSDPRPVNTATPSSSTSGAGALSTSARRASSSVSPKTASSSSINTGETHNSTRPEGSGTVATDQGVPGWGVAILVLAAVILFFMLILLILLLLCWCCWWKQYGFMNVSDPDPTGYYNPDIPMYSTHSTYDSHNGKPLVADSETL